MQPEPWYTRWLHGLGALVAWQACVFLLTIIFFSSDRPQDLPMAQGVLSLLTFPLGLTMLFFLRHRAARRRAQRPLSKAERAQTRAARRAAPVANLRDTINAASSSLWRNGGWGLAGSLVITTLLTLAMGPTLQETPMIFGITGLIVTLAIELPILVGTLLGFAPELAQSALDDRSIVRERRALKNNSELSGGLQVAQPSSSGDLSMAHGVGGMELAEQKVTLDFAQEEEVAEELHEVQETSSR